VPRIARSRLVTPESANHCFWRSHNHAPVLESDAARHKFLGLLAKYKDRHGVIIHSYCLMGTHPHVVCRATRGQVAFSDFWKVVNQCFARWYNRRTGGRGQVVMDRLGSPRIQRGGRHVLEVMQYGDLNPVRARLVRKARDWPWSSHAHFAHGRPDPLVTDPPEYLALGRSRAARCMAYLRLFARNIVGRIRRRRADFTRSPFIGDRAWVVAQTDLLESLPAG
jgi:putative transposase